MTKGNAPAVSRAWKEGRPMQGYGALWTTGDTIYSYNLPIGFTAANGDKVVIEYTRQGSFYSSTTSKHVSQAHGQRRVMPGDESIPAWMR